MNFPGRIVQMAKAKLSEHNLGGFFASSTFLVLVGLTFFGFGLYNLSCFFAVVNGCRVSMEVCVGDAIAATIGIAFGVLCVLVGLRE